MHPPIGGGVSTDFKSSNRIKISWLVQILLHFYWFGAPTPPGGGGGWSGYLEGWGWCGDLLDNVGMTGMMWGWRGRWGQHVETTDHGDHMETTWAPSGGYGDNMRTTGMTGMMGTMWGRCGDDMGMTGTTCGDHRPWRPHGDLLGAMGTTWGWQGRWGWQGQCGMMWGWHGDDGDDVGTTGMMQGRRGPCGDNKITKNAITFEQIEIIEFRLKIWDPWALPHTCRLQLMCRWGGVLSQMAFLSKKCSGDPRKKFFSCFCTGSH